MAKSKKTVEGPGVPRPSEKGETVEVQHSTQQFENADNGHRAEVHETHPEAFARYQPIRQGAFVKIVQGEYEGAWGWLQKIDRQSDGDWALVSNRDHRNSFPALISVPLDHVRPTAHTGGRS